MNWISFAAGIFVGAFLGIGGALLYLRWKMQKQLGMMEDQMSNLMESTQQMTEGLGDLEDVEGVEEVENKEDKE